MQSTVQKIVHVFTIMGIWNIKCQMFLEIIWNVELVKIIYSRRFILIYKNRDIFPKKRSEYVISISEYNVLHGRLCTPNTRLLDIGLYSLIDVKN